MYDAVARGARTHQLPGPFSDFVTRVQHTLALLEDGDVVLSAEAASEVLQLRGVLAEWLQAHPHILRAVASSSSQTEDETEQAA
ncbi:hypothetical protein P9869_38840 [Streptomyces ossamyceticus]|nr:hypothetical protein [Streptomyces ossamyceticus]